MSKRKSQWRPAKIHYIPTDDKITSAAGLGWTMEHFDKSPFAKEFAACLPERSSNRSLGSYRLGLIQLSSFIHGHDSIDDLEIFRKDPTFKFFLKGEIAAPRTMGDFLRDFTDENLNKLNKFLHSMSYRIHLQFNKSLEEQYQPGPLTVDIDSTHHIQQAQKIEGLAWNYKDQWCLETQVAYDRMGFCHGLQMRSGNTKSGVDADLLIEQSLADLSYATEKYIGADSAYCFQDVFRKCLTKGAQFTITANDATTGWKSEIDKVSQWTHWEYGEEEKLKAAARNKELPQVELGYFYWQPGWAKNIRFPIVVKRTWKTGENLDLFSEKVTDGDWDYYAVVTNFPLHKWSLQEVIEHHNKRGNAENFIREEKYGYDLKHFPCQKLKANHAFALLAMVAHNILRWIAYSDRPHKPHFAKKIRNLFIYVPGKLVSHARQLYMKIPRIYWKEVERIKEAWTYNSPSPSHDTS